MPSTVLNHDGVGGEITDPPVVSRDEDRDRAGEIEDGKEVDETQEVSQNRWKKPDRLPLSIDDPDPKCRLARGLTGIEYLEQDEIQDQAGEEHR